LGKKKKFDDGDTPGLTRTLSETCSGRAALRREQRERLEKEQREKGEEIRATRR
jgi:hypothetical protein